MLLPRPLRPDLSLLRELTVKTSALTVAGTLLVVWPGAVTEPVKPADHRNCEANHADQCALMSDEG